jgi:class 3 adenylate cyclase/HAMP domain-containing protein
LQQLGVRGRLFLAFLGISAFAVFAATAALYAFLQLGEALDQIAQKRVPAALASQQLSRQAERVVSMAPAYLSVTTVTEHEQLSSRIAAEIERLQDLLSEVKRRGIGAKYLNLIEPSVERLVSNLESLGTVISAQLEASDRKAELLRQLSNTHTATQRLLAPGLRVMEADLSRIRKSIDDGNISSDQKTRTMAKAAQSIAALQPLQKTQFEESNVHDILLRASVSQLADLPILSFPLERSVSTLERVAADMDEMLRSRITNQIKEFRNLINGPNSILRARELELEIMNNARLLLNGNVDLSRHLTDVVDRLVAATNEDIEIANRHAVSVQHWSTGVMLTLVGLSLISSILIVWLYVGRSIVSRITELSECMESVAGGDLRVQLPSRDSDDEIGRMTKALKIFRDTAVEIEENNLREIGKARQRLLDAIESISEGFCYFDASDKLVVANNQYRALMYPGDENAVVEGMSFEQIIRKAVQKGYIKDAEENVERWVAERLAQHRHPGLPNVHQRPGGRWIMVSERKTADGGTVAIYSDITELKQRETELSEKSRSMESLSNQIAKYLSPQVYDSIFTGKREVKVISHRKKLSIFFSDIAGFTETAEQMESEDLTKLLNHYLTEMSEIALEYGATIDKYVGDAIVIFFGDPETRGPREDALSCVEMAIAMRQKMKELQGLWRDSGIARPLECRIGINTGFCTVGNFGSEDRMDYTIIGSGVNLASRLESAASPGEILTSYETYAVVKDRIHCEKVGEINLKGISHPIEAYRVIDSYKNLQRERDAVHEEFPNFNLDINIEDLSPDERGRAVAALTHALEKLGRTENVDTKSEDPTLEMSTPK